MFKIKHNGDGVIEFRDGEMSRVKYTYEMKVNMTLKVAEM